MSEKLLILSKALDSPHLILEGPDRAPKLVFTDQKKLKK